MTLTQQRNALWDGKLSAADWEHICEHAKARWTLTESGDRLDSILCQEPTPGLWVFSERDRSLMPYDKPARLWADEVNFDIGYGRFKASEAADQLSPFSCSSICLQVDDAPQLA
jgi:hypothetical protein